MSRGEPRLASEILMKPLGNWLSGGMLWPRMDAINFQSAVARMQAAQAARAYGQPRSNQPAAQAATQSTSAQQAAQASPARARIVSQLVAATVPGGVDFGANAAPRPTAAIAMYRHPADKNMAATGVAMNAWPGRTIDVEG